MPVEIVFDQDLGDLFVIRVAGNIVAPSQLGSVEFAAEQFGTRLVVVLGHTHCGADPRHARAAAPAQPAVSPHTRFIADRIEPAVAGLLAPELGYDRRDADPQERARERSPVGRAAAPRIEDPRAPDRDDELLVVGAEYSLETGRVEFLDDCE